MKTFVKNRFGVIAALAVVLALAFGCAYSVASADDDVNRPTPTDPVETASSFRITKDFIMSMYSSTPDTTFTFKFELKSVDDRTTLRADDGGAIADQTIHYDAGDNPQGKTIDYIHRVKSSGQIITYENSGQDAGFQFNHAGVYKYLVTETTPTTKVDGVTYDGELDSPHGYFVYVYVKNTDNTFTNYSDVPVYDTTKSKLTNGLCLKVQAVGVAPATLSSGTWTETDTKVAATAATNLDPTTGAITAGSGQMFFDNYYAELAPFKITQTVKGKDADATLPFPVSAISVEFKYPDPLYSGKLPANLIGQVYDHNGNAMKDDQGNPILLTLTGTEDSETNPTKITYANANGIELTSGQYVLFEKGATGAADTVTSVPVGSVYEMQEVLPGDAARIQYTPTATAAANSDVPTSATQVTSSHQYAKGETAYIPTPQGTTTSPITTNYIGPKSTVTPNTPVNTASFLNEIAEITPTGILLAALPWVIGLILVGGAIAYYVISRKKRDRVQA